ncbi:fatty acid--CoA ligase family protein [Couchioplanes caeruleus]|uniref:class I adenylate-forming enzyme family protein n=1 Tax=Couchioplanes caeruleus TaxID=56438 RepID=UPI0020C0B4CF|nr:fatty acid--CoA ligase family protein [Couchioplanes caeruleus]UQU67725.1 fatty acid--CoA ligase family protein [Couchioplanes caeruleus]
MDADQPSTLADALSAAWRRRPDREALVCPHHRLTYEAMARAARRLAGIYAWYGIAPGDRIVCAVGNRCEHLVAMAAAWSYGAVHVAADHRCTGAELTAIAGKTRAAALLYEPSGDRQNPFRTAAEVRRRVPGLRVVAVTEHLMPNDYPRWSLDGDGAPAELPPPGAGPAPADPAVVFISSGTTGTPKATVGFHGNLARRWPGLARWQGFGPDDVHLVQLPLSHGFGMMMALAGLLGGGRLVLLDHFSAENALRAVTDEGVTVLNGAPAHFTMLLDRLGERHRVDSVRLAVGTAGRFPPGLVNAVWERFGADLTIMYGSSEAVGVATSDPEDVLRGSVGRPEPGSVTIVGPDRAPLPVGEVGEVAFSRGVFPVRYWTSGDDAVAPRQPEPRPDEWYYSGDLGHLDERGRLYIHGRIKHQIDRGGLKIDPTEVELALLRCPEVADAAVLGRPDPVVGETVCACVRPADGRVPTLAGVRAALAGVLAPFKLPEELCLLDEIPRTAIGKVDLPWLRAAVEAAPTERLVRG